MYVVCMYSRSGLPIHSKLSSDHLGGRRSRHQIANSYKHNEDHQGFHKFEPTHTYIYIADRCRK